METSAGIYRASRLYSRTAWAATAGSLISVLCGTRAPLAFVPALLCAATAGVLFWLSKRPPIEVFASRFHIGRRAVAWREVLEINTSRFTSPLLLKILLTNHRKLRLIFPGDPEHIAQLLYQLRKNSYLATFDRVPYREYWTCVNLSDLRGEESHCETPDRVLTQEDEQDIERMYQRLKSVGRLDAHDQDDADAER